MRQIPVVALASTLMIAGLAVACRDGVKAPAEPATIAPTLVPIAPSAPYRPAKLAAILQGLAARTSASASRAPSAASGMKASFTVIESSSDATQMNVSGLVSLNPGGVANPIMWGTIGNTAVTGYGLTADNFTHAFYWSLTSNSGMDLGVFGTGSNSAGEGVNDKGDVVGWSEIAPNGAHHGFISIAGAALQDIGTLDPSNASAWVNAYAVNNSDQVVGAAEGTDGAQHAFLWDGAMHDLGFAGDNTQALGISGDGGTVMGSYTDASGNDRTWIWHTGDAKPHDLGIFAGTSVFPTHMNAGGQISGFVIDPSSGGYRGFVYSPNGSATMFGTSIVTIAFGMNNRGDAVGVTYSADGSSVLPIMWSAANGMQDLSGLLPSLPMLYGVNDNELAVAPPNLLYQLKAHPAPLAANATAQTAMNTAVTVTVSASDPDGETITYDSTTGPQHGTVSGTGPNYTYTPQTGFTGTDSFSYWVSDSYHVANVGTVTINVASNHPPVAIAGGNNQAQNAYTGLEGSPIAFAGSGSDPNNDPITYAWDFGDGSSASTASASHAYADNGTYTATLTVTDSHGATNSAKVQVTVANVPPTGTFNTTPVSVDEGGGFTLSITNVTDPSSVDTKAGFTYAFDCGAGFGAWGSSSSITCAAPNTGTLTVHAKVQDKDGGVTQYDGSVTVNNVAPNVTLGAAATINSGDTYALTGSFSDPGVNDNPWNWAVNWGMGAPTTGTTSTQGAIAASQRYLAAGTYTVTLSVTDKNNGTGTAKMTLTVLRLPVGLDINPGDPTNGMKLNANSQRDIQFAILSSASFDARLVDVSTARVGGASVAMKGNGAYVTSVQDVNGDGLPDLVLHFNMADLMATGGLNANSTSLTLLATLTDGRQITATDVVNPM